MWVEVSSVSLPFRRAPSHQPPGPHPSRPPLLPPLRFRMRPSLAVCKDRGVVCRGATPLRRPPTSVAATRRALKVLEPPGWKNVVGGRTPIASLRGVYEGVLISRGQYNRSSPLRLVTASVVPLRSRATDGQRWLEERIGELDSILASPPRPDHADRRHRTLDG